MISTRLNEVSLDIIYRFVQTDTEFIRHEESRKREEEIVRIIKRHPFKLADYLNFKFPTYMIEEFELYKVRLGCQAYTLTDFRVRDGGNIFKQSL